MKKEKNVLKYVLAAIIIVSVLIMLGFMFANNKEGQYTNTINLCVGAFLGAFTTIYNYEFGSSRGSAEKNDMIYNSTPLSKTE